MKLVVVGVALVLAGCQSKGRDKPTEAIAPVTSDSSEGAGSAVGSSTPGLGSDFPIECSEYKALIEKLAGCTKIPKEERDHMTKAYAATSATWPDVPIDGRVALSTACKEAAKATQKAGAKCWLPD